MKCRAWPPCSSLKSRRLQALAERCVALSPGVLDAPTLGTTGHVVVDHNCLAHVLELGPDGRLIACRGASGNFDRGQRPVLALNEIVITEGRLVVRPPVGAIPFLQETLIKKPLQGGWVSGEAALLVLPNSVESVEFANHGVRRRELRERRGRNDGRDRGKSDDPPSVGGRAHQRPPKNILVKVMMNARPSATRHSVHLPLSVAFRVQTPAARSVSSYHRSRALVGKPDHLRRRATRSGTSPPVPKKLEMKPLRPAPTGRGASSCSLLNQSPAFFTISIFLPGPSRSGIRSAFFVSISTQSS